MLTFLVVAGLFVFLIYRVVKFWIFEPWSIHRYLWKQGIPGKYTPIIGDLLDRRRALLADDPYSFIREMTVQYGDYYHSSFGPKASLNISDPSLIEGVLKINARAYHKSKIAKIFLASLIGYENMLLSEDEQHSRHRRLIAPVFQHQNINSMIELMIERTSSFLEKWIASINDSILTLDIHEEMTNLTLDIVARCAFGTEITIDQYTQIIMGIKEMERNMLSMLAIIPIINRLPLPNKQRTDQSRENIKRVVQLIINQRKTGLTKAVCKGLNASFFLS
jgi:cytochrome P450